MVKPTALIRVLLIWWMFLPGTVLSEAVEDVASPSALEAYHSFWKTFESRQKSMIRSAQKKYEAEWQSLSMEQKGDDARFTDKMIESLKESAGRYREQLEKFPEAGNRPFVLLNLSQVLFMLYEKAGQSNDYIEEALGYLEVILGQFRDFSRWDFAMFLKAQMLNRLERYDLAIKAWEELAHSPTSSVYHVFAHLAIGDYLFHRQRPANAAVHYRKALEDLNAQNEESQREHGLSIRYRLAWASYRSGALKDVVEVCLEILRPESNTADYGEHQSITKDAISLAGDALFELSEVQDIMPWLRPERFAQFSPAVGLRVAVRYFNHKDYDRSISVSDFLIQNYPMSRSLPFLYQYNGFSWEKKGKMEEAVSSFEKLALNLPANSLWRSAYKKDQKLTEEMEKAAFEAAERAAVWHMNTGMNSRLSRHFLNAASFFNILTGYDPGHQRSSQWRLKRAHCYYMSEHYQEADLQYSSLINETKSDTDILKTASWQLILTREILWRREFQKKQADDAENSHPGDPLEQSLSLFASAVEHFNGHFPSENQAVEALLMVAGAYSDQQLWDQAILYWNKVLGKSTSVGQRTTALRGIVFANLRGKSAGHAIVVIRRFLRLEDWKAQKRDLRLEFLRILSQAVLDEGRRLGEEGAVSEAGKLLVRTAGEFKDVAKRELLLRDGSYFLAIGGDWTGAKKEALAFLSENLKEYRGDMIYLLARCYEYQLRFHRAAQTYFQLVTEYPGHGKSTQSLHRAEKLAVAEDDYQLAATAAKVQADRAKQNRQRMQSLLLSAEYALKAQDFQKADRYARLRLTHSRELPDQISSRILMAKIMFAENKKKNGINLLSAVLKTLADRKRVLGAEVYVQFYGEANLLLGDEYLKSFDQVPLWDSGKQSMTRYSQKKNLYHSLRVYYQAALRSGQILLAGEARYKLADASERFADEMASMLRNDAVTKSQSDQISREVSQLKDLAGKMFSQNMIAYDRHQSSLHSNIWFSKSLWRSAGKVNQDAKPAYTTRVPHALHLDLPYLWSL